MTKLKKGDKPYNRKELLEDIKEWCVKFFEQQERYTTEELNRVRSRYKQATRELEKYESDTKKTEEA